MPLLVYFAPVRVAPRRLLDGRAHTGSSANALHAAADIIRVGLFTSTLYQPPSEPSLPPPPELEVAPQDASHGRSLGGRPRLVADHTHKEPCTKIARAGTCSFLPISQ